jgi:hypothetical protein
LFRRNRPGSSICIKPGITTREKISSTGSYRFNGAFCSWGYPYEIVEASNIDISVKINVPPA